MVEPGGCDVRSVALLYRDGREIVECPHALVGKRGQSCHASQCQQKSTHEILVLFMYLPSRGDLQILLASPLHGLAIWTPARTAVDPHAQIDEMSARTARRRMTSPVGLGGRHSQ